MVWMGCLNRLPMEYISTRNSDSKVSFSQAVEHGLAPDGGLYIPSQLPNLKPHLDSWSVLSYPELCKAFFALFATDIPKTALDEIIDRSYLSFDDPASNCYENSIRRQRIC